MANHIAVCVVPFEHVTEASILTFGDRDIEFPEVRRVYRSGDEVSFGSKRARSAFMTAHAGKFSAQ